MLAGRPQPKPIPPKPKPVFNDFAQSALTPTEQAGRATETGSLLAGFSHKRHALYFTPGTAHLIDQWLRAVPRDARILLIIPPDAAETGREMLARHNDMDLASLFLVEGEFQSQFAPIVQGMTPLDSLMFPMTGRYRELQFQPLNCVPNLQMHYPMIRQLWLCGFRQFALSSFAGVNYLPIPHLLDEYVGRHKGKRCFLVGNGPSLNQLDMSLLKDEITFGANRCYMGYEQWGFPFTYWGIVDRLQIEEYGIEYIDNVPPQTPKFFPFEYATVLDVRNGCPIPFDYDHRPPYKFSGTPDKLFLGFTIIYTLMQIAVIMGCNPIYLIGCDHRYNLKLDEKNPEVIGTQNSPVWSVQDASKPTHFTEKYTAEGEKPKKFITPKPERAEAAFEVARKWCEARGIQVYNATPNSGLEVFEMIDYNDLFERHV